MTIPKWVHDACESIDAGFFSGDTFHDEQTVEKIVWYTNRWQREIVRIRKIIIENKPFW